jgi:hypothetical protein
VKAALVISEKDNVATALEPLEPGRTLELNGASVTIVELIASGHKVALRAIPAGQAVVKYGSPIGVASADIAPGMHVHTHNVASSRGRGDLDPSARLAEPPFPRTAPLFRLSPSKGGQPPFPARAATSGCAAEGGSATLSIGGGMRAAAHYMRRGTIMAITIRACW